ncbi:hypothetical protein Tco_1442728 [Tanacetum coccineum]
MDHLSPLSIKGHVNNGESTKKRGFCTKSLTKEAQMHPKENDTLAIPRCPQLDLTDTIDAQIIEEMIGQD